MSKSRDQVIRNQCDVTSGRTGGKQRASRARPQKGPDEYLAVIVKVS